MKHIISILIMISNFACGTAKTTDNRPGLLVLGDSISLGYTPHLAGKMSDFNVRHPSENCQNTTKTIAYLETWLAEYPDNKIITWNNGNWNARDMSTYGAGSPNPEWVATSLEQYETDLITIGTRLVATGAKIFFITTTSTIPGNPLYIEGRDQAENEIAKRVLPALGITIIDLYAFQIPHMEWHFDPINVHFSDYGSDQLASFIASQIKGE